MQVLVYLLQRPGELVSKESLNRAIWNDSAVTDDALVQCVVDIRKVLGDDPRHPRYVRTVPKRGYIFIGPVVGPSLETDSATTTSAPSDQPAAPATAISAEPLRSPSRWPQWATVMAAAALIAAITFQGRGTLVPSPATHAGPASASHLDGVKTANLDALRQYALGLDKARALQWNAAIAHFEAAIKSDPDFAMAHARIGYTYAVILGWTQRGEGYLAKAFQLSDRLREKDRLSILAWYALAKLDYDGAVTPLRTLIAHYPEDIEPYWLLARVLRGEEQWEEAEAVITAGLRIDPSAKDLHNELRNVYASTWRLEPARVEAEKYLALSPDEPNAHDSLGLVLQQAGNYAEALRHYQHALDLDPAFDIAIFHIGNTYAEQGRYREALAAYQRHVDMMKEPELKLRGTAAQGWVHFVRGDLDSAWRLVNLVQSENSRPRYDIALIALARGARDRFEAELRVPQTNSNRGSRFPRMLDALAQGVRAQADGDIDAALAAYRKATLHAPIPWAFPTFDDCLAQAFFDFGRLADARAEYERLLKLNPSAGRFYLRLAQIAERERRVDDARAQYRRFLSVWSTADADAPEIIHARRRLKEIGRAAITETAR